MLAGGRPSARAPCPVGGGAGCTAAPCGASGPIGWPEAGKAGWRPPRLAGGRRGRPEPRGAEAKVRRAEPEGAEAGRKAPSRAGGRPARRPRKGPRAPAQTNTGQGARDATRSGARAIARPPGLFHRLSHIPSSKFNSICRRSYGARRWAGVPAMPSPSFPACFSFSAPSMSRGEI